MVLPYWTSWKLYRGLLKTFQQNSGLVCRMSYIAFFKSRKKRQKFMLCSCILSGFSKIEQSQFTPYSHPNHRNQHPYLLIVPFTHILYHQSYFSVSVAHLWDTLPNNIICAPSKYSVKRMLFSFILSCMLFLLSSFCFPPIFFPFFFF